MNDVVTHNGSTPDCPHHGGVITSYSIHYTKLYDRAVISAISLV
ncbi:hypothetical protein [Streptomyces cyaneogriseus]|nr:hypothetical protein [Streptomyces cyaneogriseus]